MNIIQNDILNTTNYPTGIHGNSSYYQRRFLNRKTTYDTRIVWNNDRTTEDGLIGWNLIQSSPIMSTRPNLTNKTSSKGLLKTRISGIRPHTTGPRTSTLQANSDRANPIQLATRTQQSAKQWKAIRLKKVPCEEAEEGKETPIETFRRIAKSVRVISGICLVVKRYAQRGVQMEWETIQANLKLFAEFDCMLAFSVDTPELNIRPIVSGRLKVILAKSPENRTVKEIQSVKWILKENDAFQGYPLATQVELCKCMQYQRYEARRIVLRKGHPAEGFYIIISGTVMINTHENGKPVVKEEIAGGSFGDIELENDIERLSTVVCKTDVELMVIFKEDFEKIIKGPQLQQKERHVDYLRSLPLFKNFPVENLRLTTGDFFHKYYKKGKVIVPSANDNDYIIVVQEGKCDIITELQLHPKRPHTANHLAHRESEMEKLFPTLTNRRCIRERVRRAKSATAMQWEMGQQRNNMQADIITGYTTPDKILKREENKILQRFTSASSAQSKSTTSVHRRYAHLRSLHAGSFFGLESMFQDYPTNIMLISDGAECIFLSRKLFIRNCDPPVLQRVSQTMMTYPPEEFIYDKLEEAHKWDMYKKSVLSDIVCSRKSIR